MMFAMRTFVVKMISALSVATLLLSCQVKMPEDVLPPDKMEVVLYDYHMTQSMALSLATADYKEKLMYTHVYDKHGITKEMFDSSLVWYNRYPRHMKRIYANIENRLNREIDELAAIRGLQNETVDISVVDFTAGNAELWTGHPVKMLSSVPHANKVAFSFETPKDSSFMAGDSLVFSFNAEFLSDRTGDVKQEAYAAITLVYNDGSYDVSGLSIDEAGHYALAEVRNYRTRISSVSGYIYYFDNDSSKTSVMLLDRLSLRRLHPVKNVGIGFHK